MTPAIQKERKFLFDVTLDRDAGAVPKRDELHSKIQRAANVKPSTLGRHIEFDPRLPDSDREETRHQVKVWADRQIVKSRWESQFAAMRDLKEGGALLEDDNPQSPCNRYHNRKRQLEGLDENSDRQGRGGPNH